MTVVMNLDLPVPRDVLEAVSEEMGVRNDPPAGLISHVMTETTEGVHVIDLWDSEEAFHTFQTDRLMPALGKILSSKGIPVPDVPPQADFTPAYDLVRGK